MDKIQYVKVDLTELSFKLNRGFKPPKDGIEVKGDFKIKHSFGRDKRSLLTSLAVELFKNIKEAPFSLKATVEGTFRGAEEDLKRFSRVHAPAHLFPFLREIISNITMRVNIPPLILPPINLLAILSKKIKEKKG
ncbi:MAG: protein-export chaperone SecB [Nitrospirota bacterium]